MTIFHEKDLQFIWQKNFFDKTKLKTTSGESLEIINCGVLNEDSGPDFINAHIKINNVDLYGSIELHKFSSDWISHKHQNNIAYKNVILHVVFEEDREIFIKNNIKLPTLVLKEIVQQEILENVKSLFNNSSELFCQKMFHLEIDYKNLIKERFLRKINFIKKLLQENNNDWNETIYQFLAYNLGFKINNNAMLQLVKSVSFNIVQKNINNPEMLLALFLGQGNLLSRYKTKNSENLKGIYDFLKIKYMLPNYTIKWHFSKLHPPNSPNNRIRQLVDILHKHPSLLNLILEGDSGIFGEKISKIIPKFSKQTIENLIINIFVPLKGFYAEKGVIMDYENLSMLLKNLKPENNKIIRKFTYLVPKNAFETQALLELYNNYCVKSKCLTCPVSFKKKCLKG